jgi:hypothetical protein
MKIFDDSDNFLKNFMDMPEYLETHEDLEETI